MNILRLSVFLIFIVSTAFAKDIEEISEKISFISSETLVQFQDGVDYFSYENPINLPARTDHKIPILFFFDYDCRVCSSAHDIILLYSQINQEKVILEEYPVATNHNFFSADVFLTLQILNKHDISDLLLFETSEKKRYVELSDYNNLIEWLKNKKVDELAFSNLFNSKEIKQKIKDTIQLTENYGVFTYPYVIIDGKYVLTASTLYNDDYSFAVLDFLINKIQQGKTQ